MNVEHERLSYSHDQFVDRTDEVRLVIGKAQMLAGGAFVEKRVVIFHGARGAGKSWLLQEIREQLQLIFPSVLAVYIDMLDFSIPSYEDVVRKIILQVQKAIEDMVGSIPKISDSERLDALTMNLLTNVRRVDVLVLLFDNVAESPRGLLALAENYCLEPLATSPNTLLVLAGRGKEYTWKGPELRLKSEERDLLCFNPDYTQEQLEKQIPHSPPSAAEIWPLSGGYPWSNYILGIRYEDKPAALAECIENLLSNLPVHVTDQDTSRLKALCVLRSFSDEMIPPMLSAYFDESSYLNWRYREYRQVRQTLTATTLVKWDEPRGGYVMDDALSRVLENWLYEHEPMIWERLHAVARDLFQKRKSEYPRTAERWQREVDYHKGKLANGPLWVPEPITAN
jgi:hypothetical protein